MVESRATLPGPLLVQAFQVHKLYFVESDYKDESLVDKYTDIRDPYWFERSQTRFHGMDVLTLLVHKKSTIVSNVKKGKVSHLDSGLGLYKGW